LDAIERIEVYTRGKKYDDLLADQMPRDSIERNIEHLSEASRHLTIEQTQHHPHIEWRAIADIGNVFRHAYDDVDPRMTWEVVERDLKPLKVAVRDLITRINRDELE
jgi:uncharacterized protein with HEPN domain